MKKTITGFLLLGGLLGFIALTKLSFGRYVFDALLLAMSIVCTVEIYKAVKSSGYNPCIFPVILLFVGVYPMMWFFGSTGYLMLAGVFFLVAFCFFVFDRRIRFNDFLATIFIGIYPFLLLSFGLLLINKYGMLPLLLAAGAAMGSDTVAYYLGSLIKGPKIFPKISPKKTYSGCIAGIFGGAAGALLVYLIFEVAGFPTYTPLKFSEIFAMPILFYSLAGAAIAVVSEIGDLAASRVKRELNLKDFSKIFGSHGGVMDRLDSIMFAIVLMSVIMYFVI